MISRRPFRLALAPLVFALAAACTPEAPPVAPQPAEPPPPVPEAPKKPDFKNPGGMWMPEQLGPQGGVLKSIGLELDPKDLSQPTAFPLGAVVSLGGCSASFVSDDGLVITNHHCSVGALQLNSTAKENLLEEGYVAKTRADERWNGPAARVYVTQSFRDVTRDVASGLADIKDPVARAKKVEERQKSLIAACEKGHPELRCSVAEYYGGAEYRLIEQLEIKDVRLVFAPHDQIGNYGGEIDNWRWPRHSGDVAIFRAYVGKDNKPAEHSASNVPYHPPHHLKLPTKPLEAGDLVMVAGYPGRTNRLRTSAEVKESTSFYYPNRIKWCEENIALLDELKKQDKDLAIKATPLWRGLSNVLTKMRGIMDGLGKGGLGAQKAAVDADLEAWIQADPARKASFGGVLADIAKLIDSREATREEDAALQQMTRVVTLYDAASTIAHMAEERGKPDAERDPAFQERNWKRLEQEQETTQKRYDRRLDRALLKLALQRALAIPEKQRPEFVVAILGKKGPYDDKKIEAAIDKLFAKTSLESLEERLKLLRSATPADLKKSKDPLVQLAAKLRPAHKAMEERERAFDGAMVLLRPKFIAALQQHDSKPIAPDANGTLRITYGTVRGYRPKPEAPEFRPFTVASEIPQKHTGKHPFNAPAYLLGPIGEKKFGPYASAQLGGELPVDFLSDLDITGGNSGSATLNGRGEIVGLAFDGNYEAMASDWLFMPEITRTIHVDIRYVMWLLDVVYPGHHILKEMGGTPATP